MCFDQPGLILIHADIRLCQADLSGADRLDFAAFQCQARLETFKEEIFKTGFPIGGNNFNIFRHIGFILPRVYKRSIESEFLRYVLIWLGFSREDEIAHSWPD